MNYNEVKIPDPIIDQLRSWKLPKDTLLEILNTVRPTVLHDLLPQLTTLDEQAHIFVLNFQLPSPPFAPEDRYRFYYKGDESNHVLVVTHCWRIPKNIF